MLTGQQTVILSAIIFAVSVILAMWFWDAFWDDNEWAVHIYLLWIAIILASVTPFLYYKFA